MSKVLPPESKRAISIAQLSALLDYIAKQPLGQALSCYQILQAVVTSPALEDKPEDG
jgi:hypothetical protein